MIRPLLIVVFTLCLLAGCAPAPNNPNTANTNTAPTPNTAPSPAPVESTQTSAQRTLPLLDALFTDEKFVSELRSRLKLTDEQVNSLKRASNEEIARLQEANAEDLDSADGDARARASEKLNQILGDAKAKELTSFANEYWS